MIAPHLHDRWISGIVAVLNGLADAAPWARLAAPERMRHVVDLVAALVRAAVHRADETPPPPGLLDAACTHGRHRGDMGYDEWRLLHEYYHLRNAAYRALRSLDEAADVEVLMARFDHAVSVASLTGLRCMHGLSPAEG